MARQFNLIPPICEQAEYHMFQREKVEVQLPELFHKIGGRPAPPLPVPPLHPHTHPRHPGLGLTWLSSPRSGCYDVVPSGLRHRLWKVRQRHPALLKSVLEGKGEHRRFVEARPWCWVPFPRPLPTRWLRESQLA